MKNNFVPIDVISCAQNLIRFPSVTPNDAGCMQYIENLLNQWGFKVQRIDFGKVKNIYARIGSNLPNFCFLGHLDVVNPGIGWKHPPYEAKIENDILYGRGAVDMKGAIACFLSAVSLLLQEDELKDKSISIILTSDEEGDAVDGTKRVVDWLEQKNEKISVCLAGEPTSLKTLCDYSKIGSRGSLNGKLVVTGKSGHVACPEFANNPVPAILRFMQLLLHMPLDEGNDVFPASNLEITSINCINQICNIIPSKAEMSFNIRFNPSYTGDVLRHFVQETLTEIKNLYSKKSLNTNSNSNNNINCNTSSNANYNTNQSINQNMSNNESFGLRFNLDMSYCSEPFVSYHKPFHKFLKQIIKKTLNTDLAFNAIGGTSDCRFLKYLCPTIELGLFLKHAHQVDECVETKDLINLSKVYYEIIKRIHEVDFSK